MNHQEEMEAVDKALDHLRAARELFKQVKCPKTTDKVRSAISSAQGARRHVSLRPYR